MLFPHLEYWMHSSFHFGRCMQNVCEYASDIPTGLPQCFVIWFYQTFIRQLKRVHNTAARLIRSTEKTDHTMPVLYWSAYTGFQWNIEFSTNPICVQGSSWFGSSLFDWTCKAVRSITFSAFPASFTSPATYPQIYGSRRFYKTASTLWNKTVDSISAIKSCLKTYLFKQDCKYSIWHRLSRHLYVYIDYY